MATDVAWNHGIEVRALGLRPIGDRSLRGLTLEETVPNFFAIGIPGYQQVEFSWIEHFWSFEWPAPPAMLTANGAYLPDAHNVIVESFMGLPQARQPEKFGYKRAYLLLLEQDMFPPIQFALRGQEYTQPIVGQLYFRKKRYDQRPIAGFFAQNGEYETLDDETVDRWCNEEPGLHRVDITGMGCTFIRSDVLLNWDPKLRPWFKWMPARWGRGASDDLQFHWEAKQQGFETYVDTHPAAQCGHYGGQVANLETYREWRIRTKVQKAAPEIPESANELFPGMRVQGTDVIAPLVGA